MKRFIAILASAIILLAACNDDPKLTFKDYSGTYTLNDDQSLTVELNGFTLTDTSSGVTFTPNGDALATVTLTRIIPGYGTVTVAGVVVTPLSDGSGIAFAGQALLSETELLKFTGTIVGTSLTLTATLTTPTK